MALIPDESARVKRLRVCERELGRKMAFDETFGRSKDRHDEILRRSGIFIDQPTTSDHVVTVDPIDQSFDRHRF